MTDFQPTTENEALIASVADGVATLTINRPAKKNAIDHGMWLEIARLIGAFSADTAVRVIVLRGAGADFSAGADIAEFATLRDGEKAATYEAANSAAFAAVRNARIPVIGAIRGLCLGGGFGLAAAADLRIAADDATFAVPAARLGLAYPQDAMQDIVFSVGPQMARYLAFSGERIDARQALAAGFLLDVVPAADLDARVASLAATIAANAPLSVYASKLSIRAVLSGDASHAEAAREAGARTFASADYAEGRAAFREKRKPEFQGAMNAPLIDAALKVELAAYYGGPERRYHGVAHIEALLALAAQYRPALTDPEAVEAAIWFHDAIYDSRAKDNEARSAALARRKLAGRTEEDRIDRIAAMIEATATHQVPTFKDPGAVRDATLFLDMDLSILGAPADAFDAYEQAVRREYGWVDEQAWKAGRGAVLKGFLERPQIFHTPEFRERFEDQARENMARSVQNLDS